MATTSVHLPGDLMERLDRAAREAGVSRNRFIVAACREALAQRRRAWPEGMFDGSHLSPEDEALLRGGADEWMESLLSARRDRSEAPF